MFKISQVVKKEALLLLVMLYPVFFQGCGASSVNSKISNPIPTTKMPTKKPKEFSYSKMVMKEKQGLVSLVICTFKDDSFFQKLSTSDKLYVLRDFLFERSDDGSLGPSFFNTDEQISFIQKDILPKLNKAELHKLSQTACSSKPSTGQVNSNQIIPFQY